jgi:hypothetical protein
MMNAHARPFGLTRADVSNPPDEFYQSDVRLQNNDTVSPARRCSPAEL